MPEQETTIKTPTRKPHTMSFDEETWRRLRLLMIFKNKHNGSDVTSDLINAEYETHREDISNMRT